MPAKMLRQLLKHLWSNFKTVNFGTWTTISHLCRPSPFVRSNIERHDGAANIPHDFLNKHTFPIGYQIPVILIHV
jgi:hypothetical protein